MKLFYFEDPAGNFGDELNRWLWPRVAPGLLDDDESCLFIGIGSILDQRIPAAPNKVVFGTGIGYGRLPAVDERWQIRCVRGPLTAQALGLPPDVAITDSAALIATVAQASSRRAYAASFMPHFRSPEQAALQGADLRQIVEQAGIHYIDPCAGVEVVLEQLQQSEVVFAEAMHGAIVADALRIPWVPTRMMGQISDLKWRDWCRSLSLEYTPQVLARDPELSLASGIERFTRTLLRTAKPMLSEGKIFGEALARLQDSLDALQEGPSAGTYITGGAHLKQDPEVLNSIPWLYEIQRGVQEIADIVPPGADFILVDEEKWGGGQVLAGRRSIPFLERGGQYWGPPADDETGIRELERLRAAGAAFIVFAQPAFWWLDYYVGLNSFLLRTYRLVYRSERIIVFHLGMSLPQP